MQKNTFFTRLYWLFKITKFIVKAKSPAKSQKNLSAGAFRIESFRDLPCWSALSKNWYIWNPRDILKVIILF